MRQCGSKYWCLFIDAYLPLLDCKAVLSGPFFFSLGLKDWANMSNHSFSDQYCDWFKLWLQAKTNPSTLMCVAWTLIDSVPDCQLGTGCVAMYRTWLLLICLTCLQEFHKICDSSPNFLNWKPNKRYSWCRLWFKIATAAQIDESFSPAFFYETGFIQSRSNLLLV